MSRTNQTTRHFAAHSSNRIDLRPSRRAVGALIVWLSFACAVVLIGVALPVIVRGVICVALLATGVQGICRGVWAPGVTGVRTIEWNDSEWTLLVGADRVAVKATLAPGGYRLGREILFLRFRSRMGLHPVLVDASRHDSAAFRRLVRRVRGGS
jgi:hypothetical protein